MTASNDQALVSHDLSNQRFELHLEQQVAVLQYQQADGIITFTHTGVPTELEGRGLGGKLARAGLEYARTNGLRVVAQCWFVAGYLERHPEYQDLMG
jgi:predicted GNAT family acetyltransferase